MRNGLVLCLVALGAVAHAQSPSPPPQQPGRALTLDDALALARRANYDVQIARARLLQTAAGVGQAWVALKPQLAAQLRYTHNYKEVTLNFAQQLSVGTLALADAVKVGASGSQAIAVDTFEQGLNAQVAAAKPVVIQKEEQLDFLLALTVPILVPSAYPALSSAKRSYEAAESTTDATVAQVLLGAAQAFYAAAGSDEIVVARFHAIEVATKTLDNARARLEAGVVNRVEVTRAELALLRAQQAALEAGDARAQAYRALATLIQLREPFHVVAEGEPPAQPPAAGELERQALSLRPEFRAAERNIMAADEQIASSKWRWAPSLSGFGNFRAFNYAGFSGDNFAWALGLQLDWQLYDGGARYAAIKLAQAQRRENEARQSQLRDSVLDDLYNARQAVDTKRSALATARRSVDLSQETLELVRVQHDAGTATQLDLLQAQDALVAAEVAVAQARFDLALADVSLRRSAGLFPGK
jgi:outer membrane protein TolC